MRFDTRLVHAGHEPDPATGALVPPIHLAVTYERRVQDPPRYFYSRGENPTRERLERCLASLEGARHAAAFSSGQAAAVAALALLEPGRTLLACDDVYGGSHELFAMRAERDGVKVRYADLSDPGALGAALGDDVGLVWIETPTNPLLKVVDLEAVCGAARAAGIPTVVDNTFGGPALQQPLRHGADVTLYSTTKGIAGHSDVIGGALVTDDADLHRRFTADRTVTGGVPSPFDCYLVHRGLQTLALRTARQAANAAAIAAALDGHERVGTVRYPGLAAHPQHAVAARQMAAPGTIVSFDYLGDPAAFMDRLQLFGCAVSLGGVRSLVEVPAAMTHARVPRAARLRLGVTDRLVRISAGIEDPADLLDDLRTAL